MAQAKEKDEEDIFMAEMLEPEAQEAKLIRQVVLNDKRRAIEALKLQLDHVPPTIVPPTAPVYLLQHLWCHLCRCILCKTF